MIERLRDVQCVLLAKVEESLECLDRIDTKELCDVLDMIKDRSNHNFDTNVASTDNILTLSTCYNNSDKMVVHAKLIKKESK